MHYFDDATWKPTQTSKIRTHKYSEQPLLVEMHMEYIVWNMLFIINSKIVVGRGSIANILESLLFEELVCIRREGLIFRGGEVICYRDVAVVLLVNMLLLPLIPSPMPKNR